MKKSRQNFYSKIYFEENSLHNFREKLTANLTFEENLICENLYPIYKNLLQNFSSEKTIYSFLMKNSLFKKEISNFAYSYPLKGRILLELWKFQVASFLISRFFVCLSVCAYVRATVPTPRGQTITD